MSRFGFVGSISFFLSAFLSLVVATALMAPAIVFQLASYDARLLARGWIGSLEQQFDLPGDPLPFELSWMDQIAATLLQQRASDPRDIDVFRPVEFQATQHFGQISGYSVFTKFGELFIAGGTPQYRSFEGRAFVAAAQKAMAEKRSIVISGSSALAGDGTATLVIIVPLYKFGAPRGIICVEVQRTHIEGVMERGVQYASWVTACTLAFLALIVLLTLFFWGRKTRKMEQEAVRLAFFDPLTSLPNRRRFHLDLAQAVAKSKSNNSTFGLCAIDVDCFKQINDLYGHGAGDEVLVEIGKRLSQCVGDNDKVYRLSGDEFVALIDLSQTDHSLARRVAEMVSAAAQPIDAGENHILATISLGAAFFPEHGDSEESLLRSSDVALYEAKQRGRNGFAFYSNKLDRELRAKTTMTHYLRNALDAEELVLAYQPQVDAASGRVLGFEALARWDHEELGAVNPQEFINIAEQSGLIHRLGQWALETACMEAARWPAHLSIAVNLSPVQLRDAQIVNCVRKALAKSGLAPERLELEITEGVFVYDTHQVRQTLFELRELGVGIAMDDFGTGYSSLSYLTRIPLTKLKIDRSFVANFAKGEAEGAVVNCVVGLSKSLRLAVVAEGVETANQVAALSGLGCDILQGYYFGQPTFDPMAAIRSFEPRAKNLRRAL